MVMTPRQKIFAILTTLALMLVILELVRRRRMKEEYTWLWVLIGVIAPVLIIWDSLLSRISSFIGAVTPMTTFSIFTFLFLILINIHYSIKVSGFTDQIKRMAQQIGLLSKELEDLKNEKDSKD
jgi:CDP-diglyceride synthetase